MSKRENSKTWGTPQLILAALILLLVVVGMTCTILWQINEFSLDLTINGPEEVTIEYGQTYEEPGADAIFHGTVFFQEPTSIEVTTEGQVDPTRVGTYYIDYKAQRIVNYLFGEVIVSDYDRRTVHVVDTVPPEISLTTDPDAFTIPGEIYQEEGFTATDNYDGDITDQVIRTEREDSIHYEVSDSSGNTATAERPIIYHDPIAPQLVLKGDATISVALGTAFEEPGYIATDNCDGVITDRVTVTGTVDTGNVGTYTLEYSVTDSYENTATATRTVKVYKPKNESTKPTEPDEPEDKPLDPANPTGGVIYLTFDDGPGRHTGRLLDILAKYNVKASFFLVNTGYISTASRIAAEGHTVAMHSVTHNFQEIYASEEAFFADLEKMQAIIQEHTGVKSMLMRFPGGSSNTVSRFNEGIMTRLTAMVEEQGYTYFDWNVDSRDAGGASTPIEVYNNVVSAVATRKTSVVLMHDIKSYTVDAIEDIIVWGLENGYTFQALTADSPTCHHRVNN